jgi:TetR/AcrR family transcriptional regulator
MSAKDSATEQRIKDTAKRVFFAEGRFNATTQEIADAAGVNRTLVHYYFRSRDLLFEKVWMEGQAEFRDKLIESPDSGLSFKEKVALFIDIWMAHAQKYPYLDAYLAANMHAGEFLDNVVKLRQEQENKKKVFLDDIENEMKAGNIPQMEPVQFLLHLISLVSYPLTMRPLMERSLSLGKKKYDVLMKERKEAILKVLFIR